MSRIGRLPVKIPKGVTVKVEGSQVSIQGPKGKVTQECAPEVAVAVQGDSLVVTRADDSKKAKSLHGLYRNLLKNSLLGLSEGFSRVLTISGVGYKAEVKGKSLVLSLGYSTPIEYPIPEGITMEVEANTKVTVKGSRPPEGGPDRLRDPLVPRHRAVQGQGDQVRDRVRPPQGGEVGHQVGKAEA